MGIDADGWIDVAVGIIYILKNNFKCSKDSVLLLNITPDNNQLKIICHSTWYSVDSHYIALHFIGNSLKHLIATLKMTLQSLFPRAGLRQ